MRERTGCHSPNTTHPHTPSLQSSYHGLGFAYTAPVHDNSAACRAILARAEADLGAAPVSGRNPPLSGWQVGNTKVFLKFWHLDALGSLVQRHNHAAVQFQVRVVVLRGGRAAT